MNVKRTLQEIELRTRGLWTVAHDPSCENILMEYGRYGALISEIEDALPAPSTPTGVMRFARYFKDAYARHEHYHDPGRWGLYWAVTRATHAAFDLMDQKSLEPELNGALLAAIASEVRQARLESALGNNDMFAVHISNQAALGNEARSGSDFGVIVERRTGTQTRYWAALIQAKRAKARRVNIHRAAGKTTQRALLEEARDGVGAFLFYNEFGDQGLIPPTVMSASLLKSHRGNTVDTLEHTQDFAAWFAFGFPSGSVVGPQKAHTAEDALACIFRPDREAPRANNLLVAVLDDERMSPFDIHQIELDWARRVEEVRGVQSAEGHTGSRRDGGDAEGL